jgi:hypothetical protein
MQDGHSSLYSAASSGQRSPLSVLAHTVIPVDSRGFFLFDSLHFAPILDSMARPSMQFADIYHYVGRSDSLVIKVLGANPVNAITQATAQAMLATCNATAQVLLAACIQEEKCQPTPGGRAVIAPNFCALLTATRSCLGTTILSFEALEFPLCRCADKHSWILLPREQARLQAP